MGFLDRAIQKGVSRAVGNAVEQGVRRAVEPKIEQAAANAVNSAANQINQAAGVQTPPQGVQPTAQSNVNQASVNQAATTLGGIFGGYAGAVQNFANEAAKNMKICPACGEGAGADQKFCPSCGSALPEMTVAQGAVCTGCGKQNSVGTKFCSGCGAKLPAAIAEEQAAQAKNDAVMRQWDQLLPQYPKWCFGGTDFNIEAFDSYFMFAAKLQNNVAAQNAVNQYRALLQQNGFRTAGEYPDVSHLYKMIGASCYHVDTEHCFDGDSNAPTLYFNIGEPSGGFNYVKPEPKKKTGLFDLFK